MSNTALQSVGIWGILCFGYFLSVIAVIDGTITAWGTGLVSCVLFFVLLVVIDLVSQNDSVNHPLSKGLFISGTATIPGLILLLIYAGFGRVFRVIGRGFLRINRGRRGRPSTPGRRFRQTYSGIFIGLETLRFSIFFEDYLTGEYSLVADGFSLLFFDAFVLMIAFESSLFYVIGGGIGGLWYHLYQK